MKVQNNEIKIIIAGTAKVGKSTIVQLIFKALQAVGLDVEIVDLGWADPMVPDDYQQYRIDEISKRKKKTKITIEERQVRHSLVSNNYEIVEMPSED